LLNKVMMDDFKQWAQKHLHTGSTSSRKLSIQVSFILEGCTVMGIVGIPWYPRVSRGNGVKHGGNTAELGSAIVVIPRH